MTNPIPRSFLLKSLRDFAGDFEEVTLLCHVRALRICLRRTEFLPQLLRQLFVSPKKQNKGISKNAISYFLRKVIADSGAAGSSEGPAPRAHSVRSMATSAAFLKNVGISKVLEAATWRSDYFFFLPFFILEILG